MAQTSSIPVPGNSFETPALASGQFQYNAPGSSWNLTSPGVGITANGSGFNSGNPNAPDGLQVVFIQAAGSISQSLAGFTSGTTYTLTFSAATRNQPGAAGQTWNATIDGASIASYAPAANAYAYATYTATFSTTTGSHTIGFAGTNLHGGDNTVFIDNVRITYPTVNPPLTIANFGFETPVLAANAFQFGASGASWSFTGGAGLAKNGSGFSGANGNAPQGTQVVFIQGTGAISQTISGFVPDIAYTLSFSAAQRNYTQAPETWRAILDGVVVGTYAPPQSATSYTDYTANFITEGGSINLTIEATDLNGGDCSVLIDNVRIAPSGSQPSGSGLKAQYFANPNLIGSPGLIRTDATVNFDWAGGSPGSPIPVNNFSTRWTGQVQPQYTQTYTFYTNTDDGARLWVNGVMLISDWTGHALLENSGQIALTAGQKYDLLLEYYDGSGDAAATLSWSSPSTPKAIIPQSRLYPAIGQPPASPSAFAAASVSGTQINLSWVDNANNEDGFRVDRRTGPSGNFVQIAALPPNTTTYQNTGLTNNITYFYRVRAYNGAGDSTAQIEAVSAPWTGPTPGTDYLGNAFITQAAPVLPFQRKTVPNLNGIDYAFPEQTASGVALLSRFPPFNLTDRRIHSMGPWYNTETANLHFSRGITTTETLPYFRLNDTDPTTVRKVGPERKWSIDGDSMFWNSALELANQLEAVNASDTRIAPLRTFGNSHVFVNDQGAFFELGKYYYNTVRWPLDINGRFPQFGCLDIELTGNWQYQRDCFGWMYQGMAQAASDLGLPFNPITYGQYTFDVSVFYESNRQGGSGDPEYLLADRDFVAWPDSTTSALQSNSGILSMDGYTQAIWTRANAFYLRNGDGSLQLSGGLPVYSSASSGTAYGKNIALESGEAKNCLDGIYRQATRMYLMHHRVAGQYPADSTLRKAFLTNVKIGAWSRYTNEAVLGTVQNDRPLPDWQMEMLIGMYLFTADDIVLWGVDFNHLPGAMGANYRATWDYNADGLFENIVKAAHRYSALDPLHTGSFKWCWFSLPLINQNTTAGDRYFEKPLAMGKIRTFEGHPYLELYLAWPTLDNGSKTFKVWVDNGTTRSSAYTVQLQNGRSYFYDAWKLPDTFLNAAGQDINLRCTDLLGAQRTWRGDWRQTPNNTIATPADYTGP